MAKKLKPELVTTELVEPNLVEIDPIETVEIRLSQPSVVDSRFELQENKKYLFNPSKLLANEKLVDKGGHLFIERVEKDATYLL